MQGSVLLTLAVSSQLRALAQRWPASCSTGWCRGRARPFRSDADRVKGTMQSTRRTFLTTAGTGALLVGCGGSSHGAEHAKSGEAEDEVTPAEDLMREHGVL